MINYTKKITKGVFIVLLLSILSNIVAYAIRIILARNLSLENFGLFYAIFSLITFFIFFIQLGLGTALVKYISVYKIKNKFDSIKTVIFSTTLFSFLFATLLVLILYYLSSFIATNYFKDVNSLWPFRLFLLYFIFDILTRVSKDFFSSFHRFAYFSLVDFLKNIFVLVVISSFFLYGINSLYVPVSAYVFQCLFVFFLLIPLLLRTFPYFKYKAVNFWPISKKLFLFGLPVLLTGVGGRVMSKMDTLVLTYFRTFEEVGIYNALMPSAMIFLYFGMAISNVFFPIVSDWWENRDKKRLQEILRFVNQYIFVIMVPAVLLAGLFSEELLRLFFGNEFSGGALALKILLAGVFFYIVAMINNTIISAIGKPKEVTKIILFSSVINFSLNMLLIPKFGIEGAATATAGSFLIAYLWSVIKVRKFIVLKIPIKSWTKTSLIGIIFVLLIYLFKNFLNLGEWYELFLVSGFGILFYSGLVYWFNLIEIKEIKKYFRIIRK